MANKKEVDDIYSSLKQDRNHTFSFKDAKSESMIDGKVDSIVPKEEVGVNILDLIAKDMQISQDTKRT